ncbi:MAG: alkaline phosphatase family protein [Bryobacteraceae bacterium]|jgi:phospholipase C
MPFNDSRIEHFIVLMLENRSFDHMLGFSGIPGIDGLTGAETNPGTTGAPVRVSNNAQYIGDYEPDPGHELFDVNVQIFSNQQATPGAAPPMQGFIQSYYQVCKDPNRAKDVMKGFSAENLPILTYLAQHYAVCDRWFSSVPGPTLPNRSFAHAATSLGSVVGPPALGNLHTIYAALNQQQVSAKIYYQDWTMALTFKELLGNQNAYFGLYDDFLNECKDPDSLPNYCFIEPRYNADDTGGSHEPADQHPDHDVRDGEALIHDVYMALTGNPDLWQKTMLLIVYDEHGGLFDHVAPPPCENPDGLTSAAPAFDFKRLGVRVPAVIASPYVKAGTVIGSADNTFYDHTSIIATARKLFLPDWQNTSLTNRDKNAATFDHVLGLATPDNVPVAARAVAVQAHATAMRTRVASPAPGQPAPSSKDKPLSALQGVMVKQAAQMEQTLPPALRSGQSPDTISTEKQAATYLRNVAQRLRGAQ